MTERLNNVEGIEIVGPPNTKERVGIMSFNLE